MHVLVAKWPGSLHLLIMHFPLCGNAADFPGVTRWAGLREHCVSVQRDSVPRGVWNPSRWHSAFGASRDDLVFLAHSQQVLPYPFLQPVPCASFPREPGASYLQRLWFEQACKNTLESHWCQWDFSTLLNIGFRGLMRCGLDAVAVCQMCSQKPCKSPWCCHIYKLYQQEAYWTCAICPPAFRGKALQGDTMWNTWLSCKCGQIIARNRQLCWKEGLLGA